MNNKEFNTVLSEAFKTYLETSARSNKKLAVLHGSIANDLQQKLGKNYKIKSLGFDDGKEAKLTGRYMNKNVDISIFKQTKALGGIAVKFIMSNYSQNSNNYFENMLGETANLRSNNIAYFQIIIIPKHVPYFKKDGTISKIEEIKQHNLSKYIKLSEDNIQDYMHSPTKSLLCLIETPKVDILKIKNKQQYIQYLLSLSKIKISNSLDKFTFKETFIYNDYKSFIEKVSNYIKFI